MEGALSEGMDRRQFIGAAAAALFAGVVITVTGCDEDDPSGPGNGDKAGQVENTNGHNHSVSLTKAQLEAGGDVTLTLSGNGHTHAIALTTADIAAIKSGAGVHNRDSGPGGDPSHKHIVHFM